MDGREREEVKSELVLVGGVRRFLLSLRYGGGFLDPLWGFVWRLGQSAIEVYCSPRRYDRGMRELGAPGLGDGKLVG